MKSECCSQFQTNWLEVFPNRFLPTSAVMEYTIRGKCAVEPDVTTKNPKQYLFSPLQDRLIHPLIPASAEQYEIVLFDLYCPSMQTKIKKGIYLKCNSYWPSQEAIKRHMKCTQRTQKGWQMYKTQLQLRILNMKRRRKNQQLPVREIKCQYLTIYLIFSSPLLLKMWKIYKQPHTQFNVHLLNFITNDIQKPPKSWATVNHWTIHMVL